MNAAENQTCRVNLGRTYESTARGNPEQTIHLLSWAGRVPYLAKASN
jgi:hypothetical protein